MILSAALALAAPRCPATLDLAVGEAVVCAGRVARVNPENFVGGGMRGNDSTLQGLAEGVAQVYFVDGHSSTVRVSSCAGRIVRYQTRVPERAGVRYSCDDGYVVISTDRPIAGTELAAVREWEDNEKTIYNPPGGLPRLSLQVTAIHVSREMIEQVGLDLTSPVRLIKQLGDVFRGGLGELSDSMLFGPGYTDLGESWKDIVEADVAPFDPFHICAGPRTSVGLGGEGEVQTLPGGLCADIDHVRVLSDGHQIRGRLKVTYSGEANSSTGRGVFVQNEKVLETETPLRLSLNQPHVVAWWAPSHGLHYNHSLPLLGQVPVLEDILGGTEHREAEERTVVYLTLRVAPTGHDDARTIAEIHSQGARWTSGEADE